MYQLLPNTQLDQQQIHAVNLTTKLRLKSVRLHKGNSTDNKLRSKMFPAKHSPSENTQSPIHCLPRKKGISKFVCGPGCQMSINASCKTESWKAATGRNQRYFALCSTNFPCLTLWVKFARLVYATECHFDGVISNVQLYR